MRGVVTEVGLKHVVMRGGERNYIERWFETFNDRLRAFDCYFPTRELEGVQSFCRAFGFPYNRCRWHGAMNGPPPGGGGGSKAWVEALI